MIVGLGSAAQRAMAIAAPMVKRGRLVRPAVVDSTMEPTSDAWLSVRLPERWYGLEGGSERWEICAWECAADITALLRRADEVLLVGGFGGNMATGALPVVARLAANSLIPFEALVTLPFHFEGAFRRRNALEGVATLEYLGIHPIVVDNQILWNAGPSRTITFGDCMRNSDIAIAAELRRYLRQGASGQPAARHWLRRP
jgi:hypothetical protein